MENLSCPNRTHRPSRSASPWISGLLTLLSSSLLVATARAERPATFWSATTGDFLDFANWSLGNPSTSLDARIDNGGTATINTQSFDNVSYVYLGSKQNTSGTLEIGAGGSANFTTVVVGALNATGTLNLKAGGKLTAFGSPLGSDYLGIGFGSVDGTGSLWKVTGAEMVIGGNGTGTFTVQNNGTLSVGTNGTGRIELANHPVASGFLYVGNGGTAGNVAASEIYNGEGQATVIFNHSSSSYVFAPKLTGVKTLNGFLNIRHEGSGTTILTGQSSLAGTTTVTAGTLLVNGAIRGNVADVVQDDVIIGQEKSVGEISVLANGTLGGTGFIEGKTTVTGKLAPGMGVGLLTFGGDLSLNSTATVTMELGGSTRGLTYDALNVAGNLIYGGILKIVLVEGFLPAGSQSFDLFDGYTSYAGNFSSVEFSSPGYHGNFEPQTGVLSVASVPEPGALGLTAVGAICFLARRRRDAAGGTAR